MAVKLANAFKELDLSKVTTFQKIDGTTLKPEDNFAYHHGFKLVPMEVMLGMEPDLGLDPTINEETGKPTGKVTIYGKPIFVTLDAYPDDGFFDQATVKAKVRQRIEQLFKFWLAKKHQTYDTKKLEGENVKELEKDIAYNVFHMNPVKMSYELNEASRRVKYQSENALLRLIQWFVFQSIMRPKTEVDFIHVMMASITTLNHPWNWSDVYSLYARFCAKKE